MRDPTGLRRSARSAMAHRSDTIGTASSGATAATQGSAPRWPTAESVVPTRCSSRWIFWLTLAVVASGMAYTVLWPSLIQHYYYWRVPPDIWSTVRASRWIGWGYFSYVYNAGTGLVTLPGFELLLTPVVLLGSALGLIDGPVSFALAGRYTDWYLVGPFTMATSAVALLGFDALARAIGVRTEVGASSWCSRPSRSGRRSCTGATRRT